MTNTSEQPELNVKNMNGQSLTDDADLRNKQHTARVAKSKGPLRPFIQRCLHKIKYVIYNVVSRALGRVLGKKATRELTDVIETVTSEQEKDSIWSETLVIDYISLGTSTLTEEDSINAGSAQVAGIYLLDAAHVDSQAPNNLESPKLQAHSSTIVKNDCPVNLNTLDDVAIPFYQSLVPFLSSTEEQLIVAHNGHEDAERHPPLILDQQHRASRRVHFDPLSLIIDICAQGDLVDNVSLPTLRALLGIPLELSSSVPSRAHLSALLVDVNEIYTDLKWLSPLHIACSHGQIKVVELLLNLANSRVNLRDKEGWTALHCASYEGFADIVSLLGRCQGSMDESNDGSLFCAGFISPPDGPINMKAINDDAESVIDLAIQGTHTDVVGILRGLIEKFPQDQFEDADDFECTDEVACIDNDSDEGATSHLASLQTAALLPLSKTEKIAVQEKWSLQRGPMLNEPPLQACDNYLSFVKSDRFAINLEDSQHSDDLIAAIICDKFDSELNLDDDPIVSCCTLVSFPFLSKDAIVFTRDAEEEGGDDGERPDVKEELALLDPDHRNPQSPEDGTMILYANEGSKGSQDMKGDRSKDTIVCDLIEVIDALAPLQKSKYSWWQKKRKPVVDKRGVLDEAVTREEPRKRGFWTRVSRLLQGGSRKNGCKKRYGAVL